MINKLKYWLDCAVLFVTMAFYVLLNTNYCDFFEDFENND